MSEAAKKLTAAAAIAGVFSLGVIVGHEWRERKPVVRFDAQANTGIWGEPRLALPTSDGAGFFVCRGKVVDWDAFRTCK